jgi:hypothetical protein
MMKRVWQFVLLNIVCVAGVFGALFLVPADTSLVSFFSISSIVIGFLNYSLAVLPRLRKQTSPDDVRRRAWKDLRTVALMAASWTLLIGWSPIGRVIAAVAIVMTAVVGGAVWIANKSARSE